MIGRAAEIFTIFRLKSRNFQQKSSIYMFFSRFKVSWLIIIFMDYHKKAFFQGGPAMVMIGKIIFPDTLYCQEWPMPKAPKRKQMLRRRCRKFQKMSRFFVFKDKKRRLKKKKTCFWYTENPYFPIENGHERIGFL